MENTTQTDTSVEERIAAAVERVFESRFHVTSEPLTYEQYGDHSYFQDLWLERKGDTSALDRLNRHEREIRGELSRPEYRSGPLAGIAREARAEPNTVTGTGGYFAPPLWVISEFATGKRPERVLANLVTRFPCPAGVGSINLPVLSTGSTAQTQVETTAVTDQDIADTSATSNVVTITGEQDVAIQLLEQSPTGNGHLDAVIFKDLANAYDAALEGQLFTGAGASVQQLTGVMNVGSIPAGNLVNWAPAASSATGYNMYLTLGEVPANIGDNRDVPPEVILMRTGRWSWLASSQDNQFRPLVPPDFSPPPPMPPDGAGRAISAGLGWPIFLADSIPNTVTFNGTKFTSFTAGTQDAVVVCRPSEMFLFESDPRQSSFLEVLSGSLGVRFQLRNSVAFIGGRYPSGIGFLGGTGMAYPSSY